MIRSLGICQSSASLSMHENERRRETNERANNKMRKRKKERKTTVDQATKH
jgi:hypothetical protein